MIGEKKQTKEYIDPHEYVKEEDPEQFTVTDAINAERRSRVKLIVIIACIVLAVSIVFWILFEYLGYWLIKARYESQSDWVVDSAEWCLDNLPFSLVWHGAKKEPEYALDYFWLEDHNIAIFYPFMFSDNNEVKNKAYYNIFYNMSKLEGNDNIIKAGLGDEDKEFRLYTIARIMNVYDRNISQVVPDYLAEYLKSYIKFEEDKTLRYAAYRVLSYIYYDSELYFKDFYKEYLGDDEFYKEVIRDSDIWYTF